MALPPEVHSALLSSGPGPGPLLAAAQEWTSLSAQYASAAEELSTTLHTVAAAWQGPSAQSYGAANVAYLAWLTQAGTTSAAAAASHHTVAAAYTTALAEMPTLTELASNHACHAVLLATNFFGMNTIPIAVNESDYVRMWIQAATAMSTYDAVCGATVASLPHSAPAPQILKSPAGAQAQPAAENSFEDWLTSVLKVLVKDLMAWEKKWMYPGGWPLPMQKTAEFFAWLFMHIPGMSPELAAVLGMGAFHVLMLFWPLGQIAPALLSAAIPAATAPVFTGAAGLAGLAGLGAIEPPAPAPTPAPIVMAPSVFPPAVLAPTVTALHSPVSSTPAPGPPAATGAPSAPGPPPSAPSTPGFTAPYLIGPPRIDSGSQTAAIAQTGTTTRAPSHETAAGSATYADRQRGQRRPRASTQASGDEYMDMNVQITPDWNQPHQPEPPHPAHPSDSSAGPIGFAGALRPQAATAAAGLTTLAASAFTDSPTEPMLPATWESEAHAQQPPQTEAEK